MAKFNKRQFTLEIKRLNDGNLDVGYIILANKEIGLPEIKGRWINVLLENLQKELEKIGYE